MEIESSVRQKEGITMKTYSKQFDQQNMDNDVLCYWRTELNLDQDTYQVLQAVLRINLQNERYLSSQFHT